VNGVRVFEERPDREYLKHEVPHWVQEDAYSSTFFITICCEKRLENSLAKDEVWDVLAEALKYREDEKLLWCSLLLVMPDHLHGLFRFEGEKKMATVIRGLKRWMATKCEIDWQRGFFDHRIRDEGSGEEKRNYILENPVRAGLVSQVDNWPYVLDRRKCRWLWFLMCLFLSKLCPTCHFIEMTLPNWLRNGKNRA